ISGYIGDGVSDLLASLVAQNPQVGTLHVNSPGGLMNEALRLADLVRNRRLRVAVDDQCSSACTVVLLAAEERLVRTGARIGFHKAYSVVSGQPGFFANASQRSGLHRVGASKDFIDRALSASPHDVFVPNDGELIVEHIATRQ